MSGQIPAMRLGVARKIALGLALIVSIGMVAMLLTYVGLKAVEKTVHKLAVEEGPFNAAAYEMEVNVNGIGLAVLKYLSTRNPRYSQWVAEDHIDFGNYHATYMSLAKTPKEQQLGRQVAVLYAEFKVLGDELLRTRDAQGEAFATVSGNIERIDQIIDQELGALIDQDRSTRESRFDKALTVANLEAEIAESAFWVANYQRVPKPESKALIFAKLDAFRDALSVLNRMPLTPAEKGHAIAIGQLFQQTTDAVTQVVALEDAIVGNRERFINLRVAMDELFDLELQPLALKALDPPRQQAEQAAQGVRETLLYLIPAFLISAGLVGYAFVRSIMQPLKRLNRGTEAVSHGDLDYRIPVFDEDEFGELAQRFNQMTEQLQATTVSKSRLLESEAQLQSSVAKLRHQISERERAEQDRASLEAALRRSQTMSAMGALTAGVAHEVRNPLFGISSTLDAMDARFAGRDEFQRYVAVLRGEVDRMSKLMGDLLEYGKPTALELAPGSAGASIATALRECTALAQSAGVTMSYDAGTELPVVLNDPRRLVQVFQNLLENAIHYSSPGGVVEITANEIHDGSRPWIECVIADRGPGFAADDLPNIFEPFFTRRRGGTGLGLSIVLRIVDAHGGIIAAANRSEGGAIVTVRLPVARTPEPEAAREAGDGTQ